MKGKIKLLLFSSLLAFGTLTGCGNSSDNNGGSSGGDNNPISGLDYRVDEAQNKLKDLGKTQGFEIALDAISEEEDGSTSKDSVVVGYKDPVAWLTGVGAYQKTEAGTEVYETSETASNQYNYLSTVQSNLFDTYVDSVTSMFYIAYSYNAYLNKVETTTFLNRPATRYVFAGSYATAFANVEIIIDDATGITLKFAGKAQDLDGNAAAGSLVVTSFKTGNDVTLPTLNKNGGGQQGGEGGQGGGQGEGGEGGDPSVTLPTAGKYSLDATQVRDPGNYANGYFEIGEDGSGVFCDYVGHQYIGTFVNDGSDIVMTATSEAYAAADGAAPRTAACNKTFYFDFLGDASWGIWHEGYHLIYKYDQGQGGDTPTDNLEDALITSVQYESLVTGMAYIGAEGNAKFNVQEKNYNQLYSNSTLENDNGNYQHGITYADSTDSSVLFYAKYSAQAGYYDLYERQADFSWRKSANSPYPFEDEYFGDFAKLYLLSFVPFERLSEPHFETSPYYSCASFEYEDNDSGLSIDLTNIKVYFNKGKLVHFSYTSNGYINIDVYVTDIGSVELQLPEEGGQQQEQAVQCNSLISGTTGATFVYNRVDMGGYTGSSFDTTIEALQHTSFKFFADGTAETYYNPGNIEVVNVGSFTLMKKASENVGDLTLRTTTRYVNGVEESNTNTQHLAYYAQQDELHIVQTGTQGGNPVEVHLILTRDTAVPEHYQPGGQGGGEDPTDSNWPAKEIAEALKTVEFGSETIPAISDPTKLTEKGSVEVVSKEVVITLSFDPEGTDAVVEYGNYMTILGNKGYQFDDAEGNMYTYNSKSGKMSLDVVLDETNGTITIYAYANEEDPTSYPGEAIATYVSDVVGAENDELPELTIEGASYSFNDGTLIITYPDDMTSEEAATALSSKLVGYTYNNVVLGYVSPNEEILVSIYEGSENMILVDLGDCSIVPDVNLDENYPSDEIEAFLEDVTDKLPELKISGATYDFFDSGTMGSPDGIAGLIVQLPEGMTTAEAQRILIGIISDESTGYVESDYYDTTMYKSENEQIGVMFSEQDGYIGITIFNFEVYGKSEGGEGGEGGEEQVASVSISVSHNVDFGNRVYLVGDFCNWDPADENAIALEYDEAEGIWYGRFEAKVGDILHCKLVVAAYDDPTEVYDWEKEGVDNERIIEITDPTMQLDLLWGDYDQSILIYKAGQATNPLFIYVRIIFLLRVCACCFKIKGAFTNK